MNIGELLNDVDELRKENEELKLALLEIKKPKAELLVCYSKWYERNFDYEKSFKNNIDKFLK